MPVTFNSVKTGDSLRHPFYGDSIVVGEKEEYRIFLSARREISFYAAEFDMLGFDLNIPTAVEDELPVKRYKRLPAWRSGAPAPMPAATDGGAR